MEGRNRASGGRNGANEGRNRANEGQNGANGGRNRANQGRNRANQGRNVVPVGTLGHADVAWARCARWRARQGWETAPNPGQLWP